MTQDRFSPLEFLVVIGVAFGSALVGSFQDVIVGRTPWNDGGWTFGTEETYVAVFYQLLLLPGLAAVLYIGGWKRGDFPLGVTWRATLLGAVIAAGMYAADWGLTYYLQAAFPSLRSAFDLIDSYKPSSPPSAGAILLVCLVNPAFEEIFVAGYVVRALRERFGERIAIGVSTAIRACYHLYQGLVLLPYHAAYGIVQACVYVKYGRLWPLIVSHIILDAAFMIWFRF